MWNDYGLAASGLRGSFFLATLGRLIVLLTATSLMLDETCAVAQVSTASARDSAAQVTLQTPWRSALPKSVLGFVGWNAWARSPMLPENNAQAILAEPEVERFLSEAIRRIGALPRAAMGNDVPAAQKRAVGRLSSVLVESFFRRSGCLYLERLVPPTENQAPIIHAGLWLEVGENAEAVFQDLQLLIVETPFQTELREIDGRTFLTFDPGIGPDSLTFVGVVDKCLVVMIGEKAFTESIQRYAATESPEWLAELENKHGLAQLQGLGYIHVQNIWTQMLPALLQTGLDAEAVALIRSLGLERLRSIETVDGFDQKNRVNRLQVNVNPGEGGIWSLLGGPGLQPSDVSTIPKDALFVNSLSFDLKQGLQFIERVINQVNGPDSNPISEFYEEFIQHLGFDLEEEVLDQLGTTWTLHNAAADGWLSGMALTVSVKDGNRLNRALLKLIASFERETEFDRGAPRVRQNQMGELNVFTLQFPSSPVPVAPSWAISGDRLALTLFPDTIPAVLGNLESEKLVDQAELQSLFASANSEDVLLGFGYVDTQRQFEFVYPYAQMMMAMGMNAMQELPGMDSSSESLTDLFDGFTLPPARVIHRHLLPSISTLRRNQAGLQFESRTTIPTIDVTLAAPVGIALLLPAVQQARVAARRAQSMNNLKQIGLAAHNFHDTYTRFPAAYSQSEENKPLLSWRVHILPFIEQSNLYDRFNMDEPWDSPHNLALLELMPMTYRSPNSQAEPGYTVYLGVTGKDAVFGIPQRAGRVGASSGNSFANITDGSSNTIMAIEVDDALAVPWTKPDADIDANDFESWSFYGQFPGGVNVLFADGSVSFLQYVAEDTWNALLKINDGVYVPQLDSDW